MLGDVYKRQLQSKANNILALKSPTKKQIIEAQNLFKEAKRKKRSRKSILNRVEFHKKKISEIEYCDLLLDSLMYEDDEAKKNKLDSLIELKEEVAQGHYVNLPIVGFSQAEFILDFIKVIPGISKADVKSRMIMSPMHTKNLLLLLNAKLKEYEKKL